jgi:hypothetical protein
MHSTLPEGIKVTTFSPPQDFDPRTASTAELVKAGFPPRPEDPHHRARYDQVLNRLAGKMHYIEPTFRHNPDITHGPRKQVKEDGTETSTNWSGGVVFAPPGESFRWIEGDWVVPNVGAPTANQWYYCSNWIGIDGDGSRDVCQIGFECEIFRSGPFVISRIYPWFEWFPAGEVEITNFSAGPGDMITALLCTSGRGATSASAYFINRTTGATTSLSFTAPPGRSLVGNSAEWIVEAPTVGGQQSAMADYGEVFFSVCEAFAGVPGGGLFQGTTVNGGTGDNINMNDSAGHEVSAGNLITPTVIQCEYVGTLP